jgi:hypothetical protein
MYRPQRDQLTELDVVDGVIVPETYSQHTGVVGELDLEVALSSFVLLAGFRDVVEVDHTAHESEVTWTRLKTS